MFKIDKENNSIKIDIEKKLTPENAYDVLQELTQIENELGTYSLNYAWCSCCGESFNVGTETGYQYVPDGMLCTECHKKYTIEYHPEGAVGVKYTKTNEWVTPCPKWL